MKSATLLSLLLVFFAFSAQGFELSGCTIGKVRADSSSTWFQFSCEKGQTDYGVERTEWLESRSSSISALLYHVRETKNPVTAHLSRKGIQHSYEPSYIGDVQIR